MKYMGQARFCTKPKSCYVFRILYRRNWTKHIVKVYIEYSIWRLELPSFMRLLDEFFRRNKFGVIGIPGRPISFNINHSLVSQEITKISVNY